MKRFHIGMRNLKTSVSILTTLILYALIGRENAVFACIAVVFTMLDTVENSIEYGKHRMVGTVIGGLYSIGIMELNHFLPVYLCPLSIAIGVMLVILTCNLLGMKGASTAGSVMYVIITITTDGSASYAYATKRIIDTFIGIIIAIAVNYVLGKNHRLVEKLNSAEQTAN